MLGKIHPIIKQHFPVVNVDDRGKSCVRCKYFSTELSGSTKASTNPLDHLRVTISVISNKCYWTINGFFFRIILFYCPFPLY